MATTMDNEIKNCGKEMIVIMPNGIDAFYCNNYDDRNLRYEDFMVQELIPQVESKYRIVSSRGTRAIAGFSMGGYGATYHAFKYPEMYSSCYCMSGAVLLGGKEPNLVTLINSKPIRQIQNWPAFAMEIGTEDFLFTNNLDLHDSMLLKKIPHTFIIGTGSHDWPFWNKCLPNAIRFASLNFETLP